MSRPDLPLFLAPRAEEDFADILQYTLETWGEEQVFAYRAVLDEALQTIRRNPYIVQPRKELSPAHRIFPVGEHIIVYRATEQAVYVSRILHGHMDIKRHL